MDQRRKPSTGVNGEFSDDVSKVEGKFCSQVNLSISHQEDLNAMRFTATRRSLNTEPMPAYSFQFNRQPTPAGTSNLYNFNEQRPNPNDVTRFASAMRNPVPKPKNMPELLPIRTAFENSNGVRSNGYGNGATSRRSSLLDFKNKNRAFGDSSQFGIGHSVIDQNYQQDIKKKYESLLNTLIPSYSKKCKLNKFSKFKIIR